ncbi:hypothetical protein ACLOJK_009650 [Asimina triloba]
MYGTLECVGDDVTLKLTAFEVIACSVDGYCCLLDSAGIYASMRTGCIGKELAEFPAVPPGFVSLTSFTLKRVNDDVKMSDCMPSTGVSDSQQTPMDNQLHVSDDAKFTRSLRRRSWINYGAFDNSSDEESDSEQLDQDFSTIRHLPKGVIRGCTECSNCQKVMARWKPENACRPILDEAPVFHPTEEEFKDTLKYIASIRQRVEPYGICRIVPPSSWKPPCPLKEKDRWENSRFATRVQRIDKLQNRNSTRKMYMYYIHMNRKRRRLNPGAQSKASNGDVAGTNELVNININERFGFEPGPQLTLQAFQKYADDFKQQYFHMKDMETDPRYIKEGYQKHQEPTVENIEGEYWRLVEKPSEEIEVLYGADIETGDFGSGFPKPSSEPMDSELEEKYVKSGWNLNNFSRLPGSVLSFEGGDISGSLLKHVEDHHFYSLNYMHWGAPKIWYGVPGKEALKFEAAMKKHQRDLFEEQPDLLHKLVTQLSPSILKSEGVPVYRCAQHPGEFVLTFPRAYHSGFNCGFNCAEAVNVAPVDWLPHGQNAVELYRDERRKTTVSHDKLLLGAAREAIRAHWELQLLRKDTAENTRWKDVCGKDGILTKALKRRVDMEQARREYLCAPSQATKMNSSFDATSEKECIVCLYDLHLSAVGCSCSPDRFSCLNHAKQLCSCAWGERFFLFRYEIGELNMLVEALGGKLSAIYRWAQLDLGLSLSSYVNKDKLQQAPRSNKPTTEVMKVNDPVSVNVDMGGVANIPVFRRENCGSISLVIPQEPNKRQREMPIVAESSDSITNHSSLQKFNQSSAISAAEDVRNIHTGKREDILDGKACDVQLRPSPEIVGESILGLRKDCIFPGSHSVTMPTCQLAEEDSSYTKHSESANSRRKPVGDFNSMPRAPSSNLNTAGTKTDGILSCGDSDPVLSDDEHGDACGSFRAGVQNESAPACQETYVKLQDYVSQETSCNHPLELVINSSKTNASATNRVDAKLQSATDEDSNSLHSEFIKVGNKKDEDHIGYNRIPNDGSERFFIGGIGYEKEICGFSSLGVSDGSCDAKFRSNSQNPELHGNSNPNNESKDEKLTVESSLIPKDRVQQPMMGSMPNNADRFYRQKGPRIAKVVRRINWAVDPLEYGVALSGELWSTSQAIFPKATWSDVNLNIVRKGIFMLEVRQVGSGRTRVGYWMLMLMLMLRATFGARKLTSGDGPRSGSSARVGCMGLVGLLGSILEAEPPGSIDGFEMFGFSSPTIIQGIEAIDCNHACVQYWMSRTEYHNLHGSSTPGNATSDSSHRMEEPTMDQVANDAKNDLKATMNNVGTNTVLQGLFRKADPEELHTLRSLVSSDHFGSNQLLVQLLDEEIQARPQPKLHPCAFDPI